MDITQELRECCKDGQTSSCARAESHLRKRDVEEADKDVLLCEGGVSRDVEEGDNDPVQCEHPMFDK